MLLPKFIYTEDDYAIVATYAEDPQDYEAMTNLDNGEEAVIYFFTAIRNPRTGGFWAFHFSHTNPDRAYAELRKWVDGATEYQTMELWAAA